MGAERVERTKVKEGQVEMKSKSCKSDFIIKKLLEDMKLLPRQSLQGIKDDMLLIYLLSRVVAKEFSLDMVIEFQ